MNAPQTPLTNAPHLDPMTGRPRLTVTNWAQVKPTSVEWLWPGRLPLGKVVTLAGDPGLGKTTLTCAIAAHVTRGKSWTDGTACPAGQVLFVSAEDDPADTLVPRFLKHGGDPKRIATVGDLMTGRDRSRPFDLTHIDPLADLIGRQSAEGDVPVRLIVVDPITAYLGEGNDGHNNALVRHLLKPLCDLAQFYGVCVLTINHFNKNSDAKAIHRTMGSQAFVAAARTAHALVADPAEPARRLVLPIKNNLGQDRMGLAFRIEDGRVAWEAEEVDRETIFDKAAAAGQTDPAVRLDDATAWLRRRLENGRVEGGPLKEEARSAGIGRTLFAKAVEAVGAKGFRGKEQRFFYSLPEQRADRFGLPDCME